MCPSRSDTNNFFKSELYGLFWEIKLGNLADNFSYMVLQVVDVHKPLLSVSKIIEQGHKVVFSKDGSYIELTSGEKLQLQSRDGVFELEVLVRSPDFARPSIKYNFDGRS